jgi:NAD+ synthase
MTADDSPLSINTDLARSLLVAFIRDELGRHGFARGVVGLSGGIDSSLACFLAAEALGADNVLALRMPFASSSPDSMEHAGLVIEQLKVQSLDLPITDMVTPLFERFPDMSNVRRGNVMARTRMALLYDQSAAFGGLVIGTGNKTEILLGYTTLYGDSACAINPNGDLYKTQIRQLARAMGVPEVIIDKPPSADLWPGQTDEGELGTTYEHVDRLLHMLIDERGTPEAAVAAGFDTAFVQATLDRIRRNHYKRVMPPIAKLSGRTVGYDFLYPRDWGT